MYIFYLISTSVRNVLAANVFLPKIDHIGSASEVTTDGAIQICLYYYFLIIPREIKKNYAMQYRKYKNEAGMNLTPPPASQNSHAVR